MRRIITALPPHTDFQGEIAVLYMGRALSWEKYVDGPEPVPLDDEKKRPRAGGQGPGKFALKTLCQT